MTNVRWRFLSGLGLLWMHLLVCLLVCVRLSVPVSGVGPTENERADMQWLMLLNFRHASCHGIDNKDAATALGPLQQRSFYAFDKHIKISEVNIIESLLTFSM